jgi:hypothetical protein
MHLTSNRTMHNVLETIDEEEDQVCLKDSIALIHEPIHEARQDSKSNNMNSENLMIYRGPHYCNLH